jgi:hypothetical protein
MWERRREDSVALAQAEELRAAAAGQRWRREIMLERSSAAAARSTQRRLGGRVSCRRAYPRPRGGAARRREGAARRPGGAARPRGEAARRLLSQTCLLRAASAIHGRHVRAHLIRAHVARRAAGRHRGRAMRLHAVVRSLAR